MSLIEAIQTEQQEAHAKALADYRETLQRDADPKPGDAKRLREAMVTLGYPPGRLENDLRILRQTANLEREAADATAELEQEGGAAWQTVTAYNAESDRIAIERTEEAGKLTAAARALSGRLDRARDAGRRLTELRHAHRELFGLPEPEPEPGFSQTIGATSPPVETEAEKAARRPIPLDCSALPRAGTSEVLTSAQRQAVGA